MTVPPPATSVHRTAWRHGRAEAGERTIPEEVPVALTYNRVTFAVMLASPSDLEDFAVGFSLAQGIVRRAAEIDELTIVPTGQGIELRMWLSPERDATVAARRRYMAGPTGCGLCGIESLAEALPDLPHVASTASFTAEEIAAAMASLPEAQALNRETHAVHGAAFWTPPRGLVAVREDVGRHNALDKLAGAMARGGIAADDGMLLLSSRVSVELIQKAAIMGAPVLVAISSPTALAVRQAEIAGITLIGIARDDGFEVFTRGERVASGTIRHVA
jgi:FdhD protein